jgi:hypothetical protein
MIRSEYTPYAVTGQRKGKPVKGEYQLRKETRESWRVINKYTNKLASAEFYTLDEALFHMDLLTAQLLSK